MILYSKTETPWKYCPLPGSAFKRSTLIKSTSLWLPYMSILLGKGVHPGVPELSHATCAGTEQTSTPALAEHSIFSIQLIRLLNS